MGMASTGVGDRTVVSWACLTDHSEGSDKGGLAALRTKHAKKDLIKKYLPSIFVQFRLSLSLFQETQLSQSLLSMSCLLRGKFAGIEQFSF